MNPLESSDAADLRRRAQEILNARSPRNNVLPDPSPDLARLIHELQVHQIELEMQNTELSNAQADLEKQKDRYFDFYDLSPVAFLTLSPIGEITEINLAGASMLVPPGASPIGSRFALFLSNNVRFIFQNTLDQAFKTGAKQTCEAVLAVKDRLPITLHIEISLSREKNECRAVMIDITARKRAEVERDQFIQDLTSALAKVKLLSGLLPICSMCKKIRDDQGYWSQVDTYITRHSEVKFFHGLCPDCLKKYFPGIDLDSSSNSNK